MNWAELNKSIHPVFWMLCHVMYFVPILWFYVFRCLCSTMCFWFPGLLPSHMPNCAVWLQASVPSGHVWLSSAKCCTSSKPLSLRTFLLTVPWWASKMGGSSWWPFKKLGRYLGKLHPQAHSVWLLSHLTQVGYILALGTGLKFCPHDEICPLKWAFPSVSYQCRFTQSWRRKIWTPNLDCYCLFHFFLLFSQMKIKQT